MTAARPHREHDERDEDREAPIGRRLLRRGGRAPEERLVEFVEERKREFAEQTARFEQTLAELEQRELSLNDSKASIERLLRLGTKELDAREEDLMRLMDELAEREEGVVEQEQELARRRSELGAVELKRHVLEQRERSLEAREAAIAAAEAEHARGSGIAEIAIVPGATYRLVEIEASSTEPGDTVVVEHETYEILRLGPSPLPGDPRLCAYLVRGPRELGPPGGSV